LNERYKWTLKQSCDEVFINYWIENYGWNPLEDNNYKTYLTGIFRKLLSIHLKIKEEWSTPNAQLEEIFDRVFETKCCIDKYSTIKVAIKSICSLISCTTVANDNGTQRFNLDI
jgi:hypothetical protein